jgi:uncharacterized protein YecT (DUF1311 family)
MRTCWDKQSVAAVGELNSTYDKLSAELRKLGIDPAPLTDAQSEWIGTRDTTCAFEYALYLPGTIAPQLGVECVVRMTRARTQRLEALLDVLQAKGTAKRPLQPLSPAVDAELNRVYRLYAQRLTSEQRAQLTTAEHAWIRYRDKACAFEGGSCLNDLERERTQELESSWIGEAFW